MNRKTQDGILLAITIICLAVLMGTMLLLIILETEETSNDIEFSQFCASQGYWNGELYGDTYGYCLTGNIFEEDAKASYDGENWRIVG